MTASLERRLVSNALVATLNVVASSILLFVLYRFLLNRLGAETLGVWSLLIASIGVARLSDLGMAASATRFVAAARAAGDDVKAGSIAETATVTLMLVGGMVATISLLFLPHLLERFLPVLQQDAARLALPFALGALATGMAGATVQSALDGCQRVDLRVGVSIAGQIVLLAGSLLWAGPYGLTGVAGAQLLQSFVVLIGSWVLLRRQLPGVSMLPWRWRLATFRQTLTYSALFQLNGIFIVTVDPLVKFMLTHFGGLAAAAYFDMALQLVQKLRQLPIAATQVLVPAMAQAGEQGQEQVRQLYMRSYRTIFAATVPVFSVAAVLISAVSSLWIGYRESMFIGMAWLCLSGLAINTIGIPSYFSNLGTGHVGTNVIGHALTLLFVAAFGWCGGILWGGIGVAAVYAAAVALGGMYVQLMFMKRMGMQTRLLIPDESRRMLLLSIAAIAACVTADAMLQRLDYFHAPDAIVQSVRASILMLAFALVAGFSLWSHPLRRIITSRVVESVR